MSPLRSFPPPLSPWFCLRFLFRRWSHCPPHLPQLRSTPPLILIYALQLVGPLFLFGTLPLSLRSLLSPPTSLSLTHIHRPSPPLCLRLSPMSPYPHTPSHGLLHLPASPHAPPPLALATNISRKDKYVDNRTGGGEMRWKTAGRSAPCGKCPSRPFAMVGDGIRHPLCLHRDQHYHPVY